MMSNMMAVESLRTRVAYSDVALAELVLWQPPEPLQGSEPAYKYRLAYVVQGVCVLRYDNEAGKGDHRHARSTESGDAFTTPEQLLADFQYDIARWNDENGHR
jgi:hypothetical protein